MYICSCIYMFAKSTFHFLSCSKYRVLIHVLIFHFQSLSLQLLLQFWFLCMGLFTKVGHKNVTFLIYKRCSFNTMTYNYAIFIWLFFVPSGSFWRTQTHCSVMHFKNIYKKHVVDVTGHPCPMLHPQQPFFSYTSKSTCMIPAIATTYMYMVTVCYVDSSMKQNFEWKNTTFPEFLINVVDVMVSD